MFGFFRKKRDQETPQEMKYLICGLGNIGAEYDNTRHNIGFEVIDSLAERQSLNFEIQRYGAIKEMKYKGRKLLLLKPSTYMNLSGNALKYWMQKEKIPAERTIVILDDLNLEFGKIKIRTKGSSGGHNGLKHIEQTLGTSQYNRIRIGIGDAFRKGQQIDFVLGKWTDSEQKDLDKIIHHVSEAIFSFTSIGIERTMNLYNKKLI